MSSTERRLSVLNTKNRLQRIFVSLLVLLPLLSSSCQGNTDLNSAPNDGLKEKKAVATQQFIDEENIEIDQEHLKEVIKRCEKMFPTLFMDYHLRDKSKDNFGNPHSVALEQCYKFMLTKNPTDEQVGDLLFYLNEAERYMLDLQKQNTPIENDVITPTSTPNPNLP